MHNHFMLSAPSRVEHWKQFRKSLGLLTETQRLHAVAAYWARAPLLNIAYDCDAPHTWPGIWEMVGAGNWCRNSVAIGMDHTLRMAGFEPGRLCMGLLWDEDIAAVLMVVRIDADLLLNYNWGLLTPYPPTNHRWLRRYRWTGRKYSESI